MTKAGPALKRGVFFVGWLLSPLTFWNDAIVNIPLSYLCASLFIRLISCNFLFVMLVFYWLTNLAGILMMYMSGKSIFKGGEGLIREAANLLIAIVAYSLILIFLHRLGILRPI